MGDVLKNSRIIGDNEIEYLDNSSDLLGTGKHADQIYKILNSLTDAEINKGFNIGLFGGRGLGKSSIINTLKNKIIINNKEWEVIDIDCRKYNENDLKRSFLLELLRHKKNKIKSKDEIEHELLKLENKLYSNISKESENSNFSINNLLLYILFFLSPLIIYVGFNLFLEFDYIKILILNVSPVLFLIFYIYSLFSTNLGDFLTNYLYITYFVSLLLAILNNLFSEISKHLKENIFHNQRISVTRNSVYSAEEFFTLFKEIINGEYYFKGGKCKRIIFIFDNIDRCEGTVVKSILTTIKTFLNSKKCIFILPIDYKAVCRVFDSYEDGAEYLRKIFNLTIYLDKPQHNTFSNLIYNLLEQNNRKEEFGLSEVEIHEISYVLSSIFADNPRKIKQFLNNLGAEYLLYNEKFDTKNRKNNEKDNNIHYILLLLKKLIIQQEIPVLYDYILRNIIFAGDILEYIDSFGGSFSKYQEHTKLLKDSLGNHTKTTKEIDFIKQNIPPLSNRHLALLEKISTIEGPLPILGEKELYFQNNIDIPENFLNGIKDKNDEKLAKDVIESCITEVRDVPNYARIIYKLFVFFSSKFGIDNLLYKNIFADNSIFTKIINTVRIPFDIEFKFYDKLPYDKIKNKKAILASRCTSELLLYNEDVSNLTKFSKLDPEKIKLLLDERIILKRFNDIYDNKFDLEDIEGTTIFTFFKIFPKYINKEIQELICDKFKIISIEDYGSTTTINCIKILNLLHHLDINENNNFIKFVKKPYRIIAGNRMIENTSIIHQYLYAIRLAIFSANNEKELLYENLSAIYEQHDNNIKEKIVLIISEALIKCDKDILNIINFGLKQNNQIIIGNIFESYFKNKKIFDEIGNSYIIQLVLTLDKNNENKELFKNIIKDKKLINLYIERIKNEKISNINSHISYFISNKLLVSLPKEFFDEIGTKIEKLYIGGQNSNIIISIFDFLINNKEIIPYLYNSEKLFETTKNLQLRDVSVYNINKEFYNKKEKLISLFQEIINNN